jgi:uncharacterized protein HemX
MRIRVKEGCRAAATIALTIVLSAGIVQPSFAQSKAKPQKSQKSQMCASDRDLAALNARVLQTELMVAALSCGERQRYNTFVTTYQDTLTERGQALQALFRRAHGTQANTRLNAFITKLANDSSQQVRSKGDEYCVFAGELFDETIASTPRDLNRLTDKPWIASRHGYHPCIVESGRKPTG